MFSWVFVLTAPGRASPTLKTGSGESRSWVRIPPHPLFACRVALRFPHSGVSSTLFQETRGTNRPRTLTAGSGLSLEELAVVVARHLERAGPAESRMR